MIYPSTRLQNSRIFCERERRTILERKAGASEKTAREKGTTVERIEDRFMVKRIILIGSRLCDCKFCMAHELLSANHFLEFFLFSRIFFFHVWQTISVYLKATREKENKYLTLVQSLS